MGGDTGEGKRGNERKRGRRRFALCVRLKQRRPEGGEEMRRSERDWLAHSGHRDEPNIDDTDSIQEREEGERDIDRHRERDKERERERE